MIILRADFLSVVVGGAATTPFFRLLKNFKIKNIVLFAQVIFRDGVVIVAASAFVSCVGCFFFFFDLWTYPHHINNITRNLLNKFRNHNKFVILDFFSDTFDYRSLLCRIQSIIINLKLCCKLFSLVQRKLNLRFFIKLT